MIDTSLIKLDSQVVSENLKLKNYKLDIKTFNVLEADRKKYQTETEDLQASRNLLSKEYGLLKKNGKEDTSLTRELKRLKQTWRFAQRNY